MIRGCRLLFGHAATSRHSMRRTRGRPQDAPQQSFEGSTAIRRGWMNSQDTSMHPGERCRETSNGYTRCRRVSTSFESDCGDARSATRSAEAVGYSSYHNLSDALRARTGLVPSDISRLSDSGVMERIHSKLDFNCTCEKQF